MSARRDELLEDALEVFGQHGVAGTSIRDLGAALGVASSTLYHHFGSKDGILDALVDPHLSAVDALLDDPRAARDPGWLVASYLELLLRHSKSVQLIERDLGVQHHPVHGQRLRTQSQRLRERLAGHDDAPEATLRAAAALGALRRPVLRRNQLPEIDQEVIVEAALAALGTPPQTTEVT